MNKEGESVLDNAQLTFIKEQIKKINKKFSIQALILVIIYALTFTMLSLGRVHKDFLGIPESIFGRIQVIFLIISFVVIITILITYLYKRVIE